VVNILYIARFTNKNAWDTLINNVIVHCKIQTPFKTYARTFAVLDNIVAKCHGARVADRKRVAVPVRKKAILDGATCS